MKYIKQLMRGIISAFVPVVFIAIGVQGAKAQSVVNMVNGDSIRIDACALGSGDIFDDGGPVGNYSNYFDGYVVVEAMPGMQLTLTGSYNTESCCDHLWVYDDNSTLVDAAAGTGNINVSTTGGSLVMHFVTDGSSVNSGLELHWTVSGFDASCPNPVTDLEATSTTASTLTLGWTADDPTGPFTILVNGEQEGTSNTDSYTLTGLNASSSYEVTVVATASLASRCCASMAILRTSCAETSVPFSEGFEGMAEGSFPDCWLSVVNFDDEESLPQVVSTQHSHGTRSLLLSCGNTESSNHFGIVATPPMKGTEERSLLLQLRSSHVNTVVEVGTCDTTGSEYNQYGFTAFKTLYLSNTDHWEAYRITYTPPASGRRLALRMLQSNQVGVSRRVYIDDMSVEDCGIDSLQALHIEHDRLQLRWSNIGNPTCNLSVRREGAVYDTLTFMGITSPYNVIGLNPETRYVFTVHPTCGDKVGLARSVTARTATQPTSADGYCSQFSQNTTLPDSWTFTIVKSSCGSEFSMNNRGVYYRDGCSGAEGIMASERLLGLAGKKVAVTWSGDYNNALVIFGTMVHADDPTTFVPLDTVRSDGLRHTTVFSVPAASTGRHIAIRMTNPGWYVSCNIYSVRCGKWHVAEDRLLHRRGTTSVFSWAEDYDTVLVQHGLRDFVLGTGTIDTFYHTRRATVRSLTSSAETDYFIYRPGQEPCEDQRFSSRTALHDYPLPYCENFDTLTSNMWYNTSGDWEQRNTVDGSPELTSSFTYSSGQSLRLASWGFVGDYYATALLPDVEVDSATLINFYAHDLAPNSMLLVGTIPEGAPIEYFTVLDTLHITAYNERTHFTYALRPSDTLFDNRLALRYMHKHPYSNYSIYLDELHIGQMAYGKLNVIHVGYDTVALSLDSLWGTDSVELMLVGSGDTLHYTFGRSQMGSMGIGGLDTGGFYLVYVRPKDEGCHSLATHFALVGGNGYGYCFHFDESGVLPRHWSATTGAGVNGEGELSMPPSSAVAVHPGQGYSGMTFSFYAHSRTVGDTLLLGTLAEGTVHEDSTHFALNPSTFIAFDTFVLDTASTFYIITVPDVGAGDIRPCFVSLSDSVWLDDVGFVACPVVHLEVDGNRLTCTQDRPVPYRLIITSLDSLDHRVVYVTTNPYVISTLRLNTTYKVTWQCLFQETDCPPDQIIHTGGNIPLPYCLDYNVGMGSLNIPSTWEFYKPSTNALVALDSWGPSLRLDPYYGNKWMYAVLPPFDVDSVMSFRMYGYIWNSESVQVGVMDDPTDTSTFIPLWTNEFSGEIRPYIDLSEYSGKRVALRTRSDLRIWNIHVYNIPKATVRLTAWHQTTFESEVNAPYWMHCFHPWGGSFDSVIAVTDSVHVTGKFNDDYLVFNPATDSTGYSCDNNSYIYLGQRQMLPHCFDANESSYPWDAFFYHSRFIGGGVNRMRPNSMDRYRMRFYGNASAWTVGPDFENIDSLRHLGMRIFYSAASEFDSLEVGVLTDALDTLTFTPVDTLVFTATGDTMQNKYIDFSSYTGSGRWVALHHLHRENADWFDVHNTYADACVAAMGAEASLSRWNRVKIDAPHTPFYMEYFPQGTSWQGNGTNPVVRVDSVPQILILEPETTYEFFFRCDSAAVTCVPPQVVTTQAAPLEVPTCVDFDTVMVGALPRNWTARNAGISVSDAQSFSGSNSLKLPVSTNSYVITPDINIDSIKNVALTVRYRMEEISDRLVVGVMSNPYDLSTFYPVRTLTPAAVDTWQYGQVEFHNAPQDAHFIALRTRNNRPAGGRAVWVDNLYVNDCATSDFTVQQLTSSSIDLTWNQVGTPEVSVTMIVEDSVQQVFNNAVAPLHIEPLDPLKYYTFIINGHCDDTQGGECALDYIDTLSVVSPAPGIGCINPTDLASPQAVFFTGRYDNPYSHAGAVNFGPLHPDSRHTVCYDTAERDPRTGGTLRTIPEGYTSSVRLGNWSTNYFQPEAEGVIYSLFVDTTSFELLLLRYAAVMQDPMHAPEDQPRFRLELLDTNYNLIDSACTAADFVANQNLGWNTAADGVLWKDWTAVGIDLTPYAEKQVFVRLTTYDCNEGSHYGYAYFTLECMRKNLNSEVCGDVDSNTLSAPEGFTYRWYTSANPGTISTARELRIPVEDITYYCEVSKLDNPNCRFTISAYGGTRYPMASFDTSMTITDCRFYVNFTNTSGVSKDGVNLIPGEFCESAYWDYGNGTSGNTFHGYAVYNSPGTYTVRLVSGITADACQDTAYLTLHLTLPEGMAPTDTTQASICDNQQYTFRGQTYTTPGQHWQTVPVPGQQCDSMYLLELEVRATTIGDTVARGCDHFLWRGVDYTADTTVLTGPEGLNVAGCDTATRLHLSVFPTYLIRDSIVFCPWQPFVYGGTDYGGPTVIDSVMTSSEGCDSALYVYLVRRDPLYHVDVYFALDSLFYHPIDSMVALCRPATLNVRDSTATSVAWEWTVIERDTVFTALDRSLHLDPAQLPTDPVTGLSAWLRLETVDTLGCHDTLGWPLVLLESPVAEFRWSPDFPGVHSPEAQFYNLSQREPLDYLWSFQRPEGGTDDTTSQRDPYHKWGEPGSELAGDYLVSLTAMLEHRIDSFRVDTVSWILRKLNEALASTVYGPRVDTCRNRMEHTVTIVNDYLQFPNLVTPNGDGINDIWRVVNLLEWGEYSMNELWIYDRTGAQVYHVRNIMRDDQFWDPAATRSPDGTYYYRFVGRGEHGDVRRNGIIEVVRKEGGNE